MLYYKWLGAGESSDRAKYLKPSSVQLWNLLGQIPQRKK
jgi:hypothetical protein